MEQIKSLPSLCFFFMFLFGSILVVLPVPSHQMPYRGLGCSEMYPQDCGIGDEFLICSEWMVQFLLIDYNVQRLSLPSPVASYTEDSTLPADVSLVLHDTCRLLAVREVLRNNASSNCELLQRTEDYVMDLCQYVSGDI